MASVWHTPLGKSVKGQSHISEGRDCEDAWLVKSTSTNNWTALCISDGAGSAQFGKLGAEIVVEVFTEVLLKIAEQLSEKSPGSWVNDAVIEGVISIRKEMKSLSGSEDISDYHATLIALLIGDNGGFYVHLGDGAIFGSKLTPTTSGDIEIDRNCLISKPENGEYSNETFFVTEHDWFKHLRMSPLPRVDWVAVATDGGCELALIKDLNNLELNDFFIPRLLMNIYSEELSDPSLILENILSDRDYDKLTQDDKTLVIIFKNNEEFLRKNFKISEKKKPINSDRVNNENSNQKIAKDEIKEDKINLKENWISKKYLLISYAIIITFALIYDLGSKHTYFPFSWKEALVDRKHKQNIVETQKPDDIYHQGINNHNIHNEVLGIENKMMDCDIISFFQDPKETRCRVKLNMIDNRISKNKNRTIANPFLNFVIEAIQKNNNIISSIELNKSNDFFKNEKGEIDYTKLDILKNILISAHIMMPVIKEELANVNNDYTITIIKKND